MYNYLPTCNLRQFLWTPYLPFFFIIYYSNAAVPETQLFPCSEQNGARRFQFTDDSATFASLGFSLKYSRNTYTGVYISSNGILTFGKENIDTRYEGCRNSSYKLLPTIMVYWTDVYPFGQGKIFYRSTQDPVLLRKASADIYAAFPHEERSLRQLFIVAWEVVRTHNTTGPEENTFQAILTTDGTRSFVLFYFHDLQWPISSYGKKATNGFLNDFGLVSYIAESSCTDNVKTFLTGKGNFGVPGKWAFQVEDRTVHLPQPNEISCDTNKNPRTLARNPKFVTLLGRGILTIRESSFEAFNLHVYYLSVNCSFGSLHNFMVVRGMFSNSTVFCEIPLLNNLGVMHVSVSVRLSYGIKTESIRYEVPLSVVKDEDLNRVMNGSVVAVDNNLVTMIASWPIGALDIDEPILTVFGPISKREISFVKLDRLLDSRWNKTVLYMQVLSGPLSNTTSTLAYNISSAELLKVCQSSPYPIFAIRYQIWLSGGKSFSKQVASDVLLVRKFLKVLLADTQCTQDSNSKCKMWYKAESELHETIVYGSYANCPATTYQIENDLRFAPEPLDEEVLKSLAAVKVYSQIISNSYNTHTSKCSYDLDGNLLFGAPIGSRLDHYGSKNAKHVWSYYSADLLPYSYCCTESSLKTCANSFYKTRNLSSNQRYKAPKIASMLGLGHILSFGTKNYFTVNGMIGTVQLLSYQNHRTSSFFKIQGQLEPFQQTHSTILKAIAIRDMANGMVSTIECFPAKLASSIVIKVKFGSSAEAEFESSVVTEGKSMVYHENFNIIRGSANTVVMVFKSGFAVKVTPHGVKNFDWVSVMVQDFTTPSVGSTAGYLSPKWNNSTNIEDLVSADNSIFLSNFSSSIQKNAIVPTNEDLELDFMSCDGLAECLFDYRLTKDTAFARITKQDLNKINDTQQAFPVSVQQCNYPDTPNTTEVIGNNVHVGSSMQVICPPGFILYCNTSKTIITGNFTCAVNDASVSWMSVGDNVNCGLTDSTLSCVEDVEYVDTTEWTSSSEIMISSTKLPFFPNEEINQSFSETAILKAANAALLVLLIVAIMVIISKRCRRSPPVLISVDSNLLEMENLK